MIGFLVSSLANKQASILPRMRSNPLLSSQGVYLYRQLDLMVRRVDSSGDFSRASTISGYASRWACRIKKFSAFRKISVEGEVPCWIRLGRQFIINLKSRAANFVSRFHVENFVTFIRGSGFVKCDITVDRSSALVVLPFLNGSGHSASGRRMKSGPLNHLDPGVMSGNLFHFVPSSATLSFDGTQCHCSGFVMSNISLTLKATNGE